MVPGEWMPIVETDGGGVADGEVSPMGEETGGADTQLYLDFSGGAVEMANTLDLEDESIALHNDQAICMESEAVASETQTIKYDSYLQ